MPEEVGEGEVIIGGPSKPSRSETTPEVAKKPSLTSRILGGIKKGYDYVDVAPKKVPVEEINETRVAQTIRNYRIETGRFEKQDPDREVAPFSTADLLNEMGYQPNLEAGTTAWREKYPEAYAAVRKGIDQMVREGGLTMIEGPEGHPDNESVWYQITDAEKIRELSVPQDPTQPQPVNK